MTKYRPFDSDDDVSDIRKRQSRSPLLLTTTGKPLNASDSSPLTDSYDDRIVWWFGKRLYLGRKSRIRRLFELLANPPGKTRRLSEVQLAVDGSVTQDYLGMTADDIRKADQRIRQDVSRLRAALREWGIDEHVFILVEKPGHTFRNEQSYTLMLRRTGQSESCAG